VPDHKVTFLPIYPAEENTTVCGHFIYFSVIVPDTLHNVSINNNYRFTEGTYPKRPVGKVYTTDSHVRPNYHDVDISR
jgi:hypothetical protein